MARRILYTYNSVTDDFERHFPTLRERLRGWGAVALVGGLVGLGVYLLLTYLLTSPTERALMEQNRELRSRYAILDRRLGTALKVMEDLRARDRNLYRVVMGMDPSDDRRGFFGLDDESRYMEIRRLTDAAVVEEAARNLDLLDRELHSQILSYNQIRQEAVKRRELLAHAPSVFPVAGADSTLVCGYGYRRDPQSGSRRLHSGVDYAVEAGTPVVATADGRISLAAFRSGDGNTVMVDHGFGYETLYSHLHSIDVDEGQAVVRGQRIGRVGSSGKSVSPHLHYEVRFKGEAQDPVDYHFEDLDPAAYERLRRQAANAGNALD